jgi:hypothetical protein
MGSEQADDLVVQRLQADDLVVGWALGREDADQADPLEALKHHRIVGRSVGCCSWLGTLWPVAASRSRSRCSARR